MPARWGSKASKRKDSAYRSGRSPNWLKMKNPACSAVKREAEEGYGGLLSGVTLPGPPRVLAMSAWDQIHKASSPTSRGREQDRWHNLASAARPLATSGR